ncbi:hypothetical protein SDC9_139321 [bioreactor metagenome]|uniref:Uncharacterized protein n=1 Tax=bioreactor metagenome TaxID=1076179 RepID=A0A645DS80_9ZZZZ
MRNCRNEQERSDQNSERQFKKDARSSLQRARFWIESQIELGDFRAEFGDFLDHIRCQEQHRNPLDQMESTHNQIEAPQLFCCNLFHNDAPSFL